MPPSIVVGSLIAFAGAEATARAAKVVGLANAVLDMTAVAATSLGVAVLITVVVMQEQVL